jgi:transposase, IS30 family
MSYKHVTQQERRLIYYMRQAGDSLQDIALRLGRAVSTISRELRRNRGKNGYRYKQAHAKAEARAKRVVPRRFTQEMKAELERGLRCKEWSPQLISTQARAQGRPFVCKETLYQYIYAEGKAGGRLWTLLTRSHKQRWRRCPRNDGRGKGRIRNQRMIDSRPASTHEDLIELL